MTKKILLLTLTLLITMPVFAMSDNAKAEIAVLRRQKNIKQKIINEKINTKENEMETLLYNNLLSEQEKNQQLTIIKHDLKQLYREKQQLNDEYTKSKKNIKRNY